MQQSSRVKKLFPLSSAQADIVPITTRRGGDHNVQLLRHEPFVKSFPLSPSGVIVFGSDQEVAGLMKAVKRCNATGEFYWIGSDGWSARTLVTKGTVRS